MIDFTYQELKEDHGLSDDQIQKLDSRALKLLGNTLIMINGCLKSKQSCDNKISSILIYVSMAKEFKPLPMEIDMKVNGKKGNLMVKGNSPGKMDGNMLVILKMVK